MIAKREAHHPAAHRKIDHQVFRADEELEWDARLAELSGIDPHAAKLIVQESRLPQSADRMAVAFGVLDSI